MTKPHTSSESLGGENFRLTAVPNELADMLDSMGEYETKEFVSQIELLHKLKKEHGTDFLSRVNEILSEKKKGPKIVREVISKGALVKLPFDIGHVLEAEIPSGIPAFSSYVCNPKERINAIKKLSEHGGDINEKDEHWRTALMYAAAMIEKSYIFNLREFLKLRPDLHVIDDEGKTVFDHLPRELSDKWVNCFLEFCETYEERDWIVEQFRIRHLVANIDQLVADHDMYLARLGKELISAIPAHDEGASPYPDAD